MAGEATTAARAGQPAGQSGALAPRLLEGSELIGRCQGSALREPPWLVRRPDGQVVQVSRLLYLLAEHADGRHDFEQLAERASQGFGRPVSAENARYLVDQKLRPLGLLMGADGAAPKLERIDPLLALKFRAPVLPARMVIAIARVLEPLFGPIVVSSVLAGLVAVDAWLVVHGLSGSVTKVIASPALMLALLAVSIVSLFWHECGHAAACRYGGAKPGAIGAGIYLVWPVFYTDVTDSYRLDRRGRLRTDLGGVYFNAIFALAGAGAYFATASPPLLLIVVTQQLMMLEQFMPWVRLDGYYVISDLIGVSNLFGRIKPVMLSFRPGRRPDPRVRELKPWARVTVTAWVLTTVPALAAVLVVVILNAPRMLATAGQSFLTQLGGFADGLEAGDPIAALAGLVSAGMLVLPPLGLTLMYLLLCRRAGVSLAIARARAAVRPPPAPDPPAPPPA